MIDPAELAHRFAYHPPKTSDTVEAHETVRREAGARVEPVADGDGSTGNGR